MDAFSNIRHREITSRPGQMFFHTRRNAMDHPTAFTSHLLKLPVVLTPKAWELPA